MTYKLEDFLTWLENNPTQKGTVSNWDFATYLARDGNWTKILGELNPPDSAIKKVILKWKEAVEDSSRSIQYWKRAVKELQSKIGELEAGAPVMPGSWSDDEEESLTSKIERKKRELTNLRDSTRGSTAPFRKQIELLEKILGLENKIREWERKEESYKLEIQQKEVAIQSKQQQINGLQSQLSAKTVGEQVAQQKITQFQAQISNLQAEKRALQERMLRERTEALREWEAEKTSLQTNLTQLKDQKDTFQKSADYLRETLKTTEKSLEEIKEELEVEKEKVRELEEEKSTVSESHQTELKNRSEAYGVVTERNQESEKKLNLASQENSQLAQWISKLESVSGEGEGFASLKKELEGANSRVISLTEELNAKKPKSYWWVWVVLVLVGVYLVVG